MMARALPAALLALLVALLVACASPSPAPSSSPAASGDEAAGGESEDRVSRAVELADELGLMEMAQASIQVRDDDYRIGPADELAVEFFLAEELTSEETVNDRGYIRMPLIGNVKVAGLTAYEVEDLLIELYKAEYLNDPQIYVNVTNYASQRVTVIGSVEKPGVYPLTGPTTLMKALAMAGGTSRLANEKDIVVFRAQDNGDVVGYRVNYLEIAAGMKPDPEIIGNDRIVVDASATKSFIKGVSDSLRGLIGIRPF